MAAIRLTMTRKLFAEDPVVAKFVMDEIERHYDEKYVPDWVDFPAFKKAMAQRMVDSLIISIGGGADETYWTRDLLFAFTSSQYGDHAVDELEVTIPEEIKEAYKKAAHSASAYVASKSQQ